MHVFTRTRPSLCIRRSGNDLMAKLVALVARDPRSFFPLISSQLSTVLGRLAKKRLCVTHFSPGTQTQP